MTEQPQATPSPPGTDAPGMADPRPEDPDCRIERLVLELKRSVRGWILGWFLAATGIGFLLKRRFCPGILLGTLFGLGGFQLLVSLVMRMKGASGAMLGVALLLSFFKLGFLVAALVGLWYLGIDLLELMGGLLASQFAIVAGCAGARRNLPGDTHARP